MTPSEFKSWFAVFIEAVDGTPTPRQWAKIQKRVDELGNPGARCIIGPTIIPGHASITSGDPPGFSRAGISQANIGDEMQHSTVYSPPANYGARAYDLGVGVAQANIGGNALNTMNNGN